MVDNFAIEEGSYITKGSVLVAKSTWDYKYAQIMREKNIVALELNYAKGFRGRDVDFLEQMPFLEALKITHYAIDNVRGIHACPNLRSLEVSTYCKTEIDFTKFGKLEKCFIYWRPKAKSLFACKTLKQLVIDHYHDKDTDLSVFSKLINLEYLRIMNSRIKSLGGISELKKLTFLGLYNLRKLGSLNGIESLTNLNQLEVNGCRTIGSIKPVKHLKELKKLHFCDDGEIDSIKYLFDLHELEEVLFYGSTNVLDGDLSPLLSLPKLKNNSFQNRKHYSHTREEIEARQGHPVFPRSREN